MTKLQVTMAIVLSLLILIMVVTGQTKINLLILSVALITTVITTLYVLITIARRNEKTFLQQDRS